MSDTSIGRRSEGRSLHFLAQPAPVLTLCVAPLALVVALLAIPSLPIGPMYWDLLIYFDAANRIFGGQMPGVDFQAPVGPLGYWLFAGALKLFPNAQPLLLADWSLLAITAPLMALVVADVAERSHGTAFALAVPFLFFSILPFNVETFYSFPGVDGFGIYNRQAARLLYVLASALVFCASARRMGTAVAGAMLSLFLIKITGFIAGGLLCLFAFAAGRLPFRAAAAAALVFAAFLAVLESTFGVVGAYLRDIAGLAGMNEGSILPRFLQAASIHLGVFAPCALLVGVLAALSGRSLLADTGAALRRPNPATAAELLDRDVFWLGVAVLAALFFETQNTGGQAFIFVWPVLLRILARASAWRGWRLGLVIALVAASSLPTATGLFARAGRAAVGQMKYERLESADLGTLGAVTQRPEFLRRADTMLETFAAFPEFYSSLASKGELPSHTLYAEPDYQLAFLKTVDEAVAAVRLYEVANEVRFRTIMNLGFVNPFPWLLDRQAPTHVAIGADPFRAVPAPDSDVAEAVRSTDLLLISRCPTTGPNLKLLSIYEPFLDGHRRIGFGRCWDGFVRNALRTTPN